MSVKHQQRTLSEKHGSEYNAKKTKILLRNRGKGVVVELLFEFHEIKP
jgi:hypothetical protein